MLSLLLWNLCFLVSVRAGVTVYGQTPLGFTKTETAGPIPTTTLPAYDETRLIPPPLPNPPPSTAFTLNLPANGASVPGLSIVHRDGSFLGFSIEMSVITQCGKIIIFVWFRIELTKLQWERTR